MDDALRTAMDRALNNLDHGDEFTAADLRAILASHTDLRARLAAVEAERDSILETLVAARVEMTKAITRAYLPLEWFASRADNTVGMAYLDRKSFPFADTVCSTERGAMVNYLVTVCRITPMADWSDAKIKEQFEMHKMGGSVGPVSIERLIVEQDLT